MTDPAIVPIRVWALKFKLKERNWCSVIERTNYPSVKVPWEFASESVFKKVTDYLGLDHWVYAGGYFYTTTQEQADDLEIFLQLTCRET